MTRLKVQLNPLKLKKFLSLLFKLATVIGALALSWYHSNAYADTALQALGKAHNTMYREAKKLGPRPSPDQLETLRNRIYSPVEKKVEAETQRRWFEFLGAANELAKEIEQDPELSKPLTSTELAQLDRELGPDAPDLEDDIINTSQSRLAGPTQQPAAASPSRPSGPQRKPSTTGTVSGAGGARSVDFGSSQNQNKDFSVVDGIIQQR